MNHRLFHDYKNKKKNFTSKVNHSYFRDLESTAIRLCGDDNSIVSRYTDNREFKVLGFKETLSMYKGTKFDICIYILALPKISFSICH